MPERVQLKTMLTLESSAIVGKKTHHPVPSPKEPCLVMVVVEPVGRIANQAMQLTV